MAPGTREKLGSMEFDSTRRLAPRAPRVRTRIPVSYRPSGTMDWREGRTENISQSGVLFRTDHLMPVQTPIEFLMALPEEVGGGAAPAVIYRGCVVRTEPPKPDEPQPAVAATIVGYRLTHSSGNDPEGPESDDLHGQDPLNNDPRRI